MGVVFRSTGSSSYRPDPGAGSKKNFLCHAVSLGESLGRPWRRVSTGILPSASQMEDW